MKPCVYQIHEQREDDWIGCANTKDLLHNGMVPVNVCRRCPYRTTRTSTGLGDLLQRVFAITGIASLIKRISSRGCGCSQRQHWLNRLVPFRRRRTNGRWAVVVTTAPRARPTIEQCVASLRVNGWEPAVFAEPGSKETDCLTFSNPERLGVWHNWLQSCRWALENTSAELILTVQDDSVFHHDTREFMESIQWPTENCGFISLYTPRHYGNGSGGLKRVRTRSLWGACALVWRREVLQQVINHRIARNWLGVPPRGRSAKSTMAKRKQIPALVQNSDTAIGRIMNTMKLEMWFVDPSPVRHIATTSSINHGGNRGKRNCGICADPMRSLRDQVSQLPSF